MKTISRERSLNDYYFKYMLIVIVITHTIPSVFDNVSRHVLNDQRIQTVLTLFDCSHLIFRMEYLYYESKRKEN